jgi:hypothetical protein
MEMEKEKDILNSHEANAEDSGKEKEHPSYIHYLYMMCSVLAWYVVIYSVLGRFDFGEFGAFTVGCLIMTGILVTIAKIRERS